MLPSCCSRQVSSILVPVIVGFHASAWGARMMSPDCGMRHPFAGPVRNHTALVVPPFLTRQSRHRHTPPVRP